MAFFRPSGAMRFGREFTHGLRRGLGSYAAPRLCLGGFRLRLERRADMYVSTLQDFVRALGGELKITAKFPEGTVEIRQFEEGGTGKG